MVEGKLKGKNKRAWWLLPALALSCASSAEQSQPGQVEAGTNPVPDAGRSKPLTELPANQPQVSCANNQLTIKADNSTLGSVLSAVGTCLKTKIEIPGTGTAERMFEQFGPGPIRQTLTSLLSSTDFDFVITTSPSDPQKIETVVLLQRTESSPAPPDAPPSRARRLWTEDRRQAEAARAAAVSEESTEAPADAAESVAAPTNTAQAENSAGDQNPSSANQAPATDTATASSTSAKAVPAASAPESPAQGKSTQDMISNMRQLFDQRKQMIESQKATPQ